MCPFPAPLSSSVIADRCPYVRVVLFYAITAVLTLFCNVIANPRDPDTAENMELLQNVPSLIRSIPIRNLTFGEAVHLQYLDCFAEELTNICVRVISKSQQNTHGMEPQSGGETSMYHSLPCGSE